MEEEKEWTKLLDFIKQQISSANFRTWFSQARFGGKDKGSITIQVPSAFIKGQLAKRYEGLIKEGVEKIYGAPLEIGYQINPSLASQKSAPVEEAPFEFGAPAAPKQTSGLNGKYTLDSFVVGQTNNLAYAAAQAIVQNPGTSYNPLFLYGPSGVGKTHLMQAVGNALLQKNPYTKLVFASSERFLVDFVDSIQTKRNREFRSKYRSCEILLIDDIQFIAGKDSAQEEFFHTFNELHSRNSQIILTSDRPPTEMQRLESRLMSRFQGGLMVDIQLPDFETRMAILRAKLKERGDFLPDEVLALIAEGVESNTRELEGKLVQILQMSKLTRTVPDLETAQRFLGKPQQKRTTLDSKKVLSGVNQFFNIKMSDLTGPRRQKELVLPRQLAMYILYEDCKIPMEKIGQLLGGRDHTTVLHGVEKIRDSIQRDREIQKLLIELKQNLFR